MYKPWWVVILIVVFLFLTSSNSQKCLINSATVVIMSSYHHFYLHRCAAQWQSCILLIASIPPTGANLYLNLKEPTQCVSSLPGKLPVISVSVSYIKNILCFCFCGAVCMHACSCMCGAWRSQKRALGLLELELQVAVHSLVLEIETRVFRKRFKQALPLSHCSSPTVCHSPCWWYMSIHCTFGARCGGTYQWSQPFQSLK